MEKIENIPIDSSVTGNLSIMETTLSSVTRQMRFENGQACDTESKMFQGLLEDYLRTAVFPENSETRAFLVSIEKGIRDSDSFSISFSMINQWRMEFDIVKNGDPIKVKGNVITGMRLGSAEQKIAILTLYEFVLKATGISI